MIIVPARAKGLWYLQRLLPGTVQAVDRAGNAVAYTSTIESSFGSGLVVGGYYLNNELTDFDMAPELDGRLVANRVESGKRPRSSMTPTLVFAPDGSLRMVIAVTSRTLCVERPVT